MPPHCRIVEFNEVSARQPSELPPVASDSLYLPPPPPSIYLSSVTQPVHTPAPIQSLYLPPPPRFIYPSPSVSTSTS